MKPVMFQITLAMVAAVVVASDAAAQHAAVNARHGAAVIGPGGAAVSRSSGAAVTGPYGAATSRSHSAAVTGSRGAAATHRSGAAVVGPHRAAASGVSGGTYKTQRGTTVTYGKAGAAAAGPYGTRVGGVGGRSRRNGPRSDLHEDLARRRCHRPGRFSRQNIQFCCGNGALRYLRRTP